MTAATVDDDTLVVRARARIEGIVVDGGGATVADATVAFLEAPVAMPDTAMLTDSEGRFVLSLPVPGLYRLGIHGQIGSAQVDLRAEAEGPGAAPSEPDGPGSTVRIVLDPG